MIEKIFFEIDEDFWCETRFLKNIINILEQNITDDYSIVITPNLRVLPETKFKKIVILTGDELGNFGINPYTRYDIHCIFRIYNHFNRLTDRIFAIPTGYNWTMHSDSSKKMIKMYPEIPLNERKYDIAFTGQPVPTRLPMLIKLKKLKERYNVLYNITKSFRTGYDIDEYYKILGDTKISICPDGTSVDTFRYTESFGSGCAVITTKKENLWYYENSPAFFIDSWEELNEDLIEYVLSNMSLENNLKYYNEKLSEEAVAHYMIEKINEL